MTAATFGLFVLGRANMAHDGANVYTQAAIAPPQNVQLVAVVPSRIEVRAVREKAEIAVAQASQGADLTDPESSKVYRVSASTSGPVIGMEGRASSEGRPLRLR
jgi:hypothetical protein